ncbi:MAG: sigma 54-interacting transcriptional regulator [Bacteroidetes bacterium]|nr:sigma 54-interacting transcriptional regulator [Bacteroidota bacterium]
MTNFQSLVRNKFFVKLFLAVLSILILSFFLEPEKFVDKNIETSFTLLHGQQQPDTNIVLIDISASDIDNLGYWPLKRSYYALLIKNLSDYKVKSIGLEVFLSAKFVTQTLYDNLVTKVIENSGNVVLSSVAGNVTYLDGKFSTDSLSYPSPKLLDDNIKTGHLNYFDENGIQIPLIIHDGKSVIKAFSLQLAGENYFVKDDQELKINFISSWNKFQRYSLLNFFQAVNNNSESLQSLKDKIVIIGISDPQISSEFNTTFDNNMPGFAIHAFALDNILHHRWLNDNFIAISKIIFVILILILLFVQEKKLKIKALNFNISTFILFLIFTFSLYSILNIELSYSFFLIPFLLTAVADLIFALTEDKIQLKGVKDEAILLKNLLAKKEYELERLQKELNLSGEDGSYSIVDKIKSLKADIEKLRENEADKKEAIVLFDGEEKEFEGITYRSKAMTNIVDTIKKVSKGNANILILGESGTGKELVAKAIHTQSERNKNNFVAVNCGALSDTLLESELFGHVKGAFTGAVTDKIGRFEAANKGTIFLDEIAETSENFQVKLLRVIQTGDYEKVGSSKTFHADVRIVAATNRQLEAFVKEKKFREDLYYRLNVIKIELPPLKERKEDIEILARKFLTKEGGEIKLSKAVLEALLKYEWKGNVRELEAVIKRSVIFAQSVERKLIQLSDLPEEIVKDSKFNFEDIVIESLRNKKFTRSSIIETAKELGNLNRTVISENFRGYSLKVFVENNYDFEKSVNVISLTADEEVNERVRIKLQTFLKNIENDLNELQLKDFENIKIKFASKYKNLPHKFHYYLDEIIQRQIS